MKKGIIVFILIMLLNSLLVGCAGQAADESADEPITAEWIVDGTYAIEVSSSSSMFRIVDAQVNGRRRRDGCCHDHERNRL